MKANCDIQDEFENNDYQQAVSLDDKIYKKITKLSETGDNYADR